MDSFPGFMAHLLQGLPANRGFLVDFYHALEHAGLVLEASLGKNHPDYKND